MFQWKWSYILTMMDNIEKVPDDENHCFRQPQRQARKILKIMKRPSLSRMILVFNREN